MPANLQAIGFQVLSAAIFASLWVLIRFASETLPPPLIVFYRTLFGLAFMIPFFAHRARATLATRRLPLHLLRATSGVLAMYCTFYAVALAPLANVVAISYATPLFATLAAVFVLHEVIRARRMVALAIGFVGVLVVLRPGIDSLSVGESAALASAVMVAVSLTCIKLLARTERSETIVLFSFLFALPVNLAVALFFWRWPNLQEWLLLAAIGIGANIGQMTMTRAFSLADASALLPFDFVRLVLAAAMAAVFFGERLDALTVLGAGVILASSVYLAHREARLARREGDGAGIPRRGRKTAKGGRVRETGRQPASEEPGSTAASSTGVEVVPAPPPVLPETRWTGKRSNAIAPSDSSPPGSSSEPP